ncbi:MAG TPA: SusC/RagA family TonB-linked outer membrane protein [Puia sp.]|nr:SusC/RagA family TonB-linked outer membrane protein [Puia sp.]
MVMDEHNDALAGVTVQARTETGRDVYTGETDSGGLFRLQHLRTGVNYQITASSVGYEMSVVKNYQVSDGKSNSLLIKLKLSNTRLNEVVVTALNIKRNVKNLGYLVESISGSKVNDIKSVSLESALSGKVAGLDASNISNGVAGSKRITLRGIASISGNNQPLWVVDGIPINSTAISSATASGGGGIDFGDGLTGINPDDIESITVLKGNASAALYGSRASTGVILITTKSGSGLAKNKVQVDYSGAYTTDRVIDYTDWQYQYGQGTTGMKPQSQQDVLSSINNWGARLDGTPVVQFDGKMRPYVGQRKNIENFYRSGNTLTNAVALSGRTTYTNFRLSASNLQNSDIIPNTGYKRNIFSFHSETKYNRLSVNAVLNYTIESANNRQIIGGNYSNVNYTIVNLPTNVNVLALKPGVDSNGNEIGITSQGIPTNPYFVTSRMHEQDTRKRIDGSLELRYDLARWLYAKGRILEDYYNYNELDYTPAGVIWYPKGGGLNQNSRNNAEENYEMIVGTPTERIGTDLKVSAFFGGNIYNSELNGMNINGTPFVIKGIYTANNLAVKYPSTSYAQQRINSLFGNVEADWKGLSVLLTGRQDWFSTLPLNSNSLFYPSASVSYGLDNRYLPAWMSSARVRGSFAEVSGGASPYQLALSYGLDPNNYNGISLQSISNTTVPNPNLKPLLSAEYEGGVDLGLFSDRIGLNLTYYSRRTTQDIVTTNVSVASGYSKAVVNLGEMTNKGIEATLRADVFSTNSFSWNLTGLFSYNRNEVLSLGNNITSLQVAQSKTGNAFVNVEKGMPYGQIEGYTFSRDVKGRIVYDASGNPVHSGTLSKFGSGVYDKLASLGNTFTIKNFSLYFLVDGKFGARIFSEENSLAMANGKSKLTLPGRENGLTVSGADASGNDHTVKVSPANLVNYYSNLAAITQNFVYDASFVKLRELSFGYSAPQKWISGTAISRLTLALTARNLFYFYKNTPNIDPESNTTSDNGQGLAATVYPTTRNIGVSLKLSF